MSDADEIQTWCRTHLRRQPRWEQISNALSRLRNMEQVAECQSYVLLLANGQRDHISFVSFLRAATRLALQFPEGCFRDVTAQQLLDWNNTREYPTPLPRVGEPWPLPGEGHWVAVTEKQRRVQQKYILRFLVHVMEDAGEPVGQARARLEPMVKPQEGLEELTSGHTPHRADPTPEHWQRLLDLVETKHFEYEPMRHQLRFALRVLLSQGNRAPALTRAKVSSLQLEVDQAQARIKRASVPRMKSNPTLVLNDEARAAGALWLEHHPFADDEDAPLLVNGRHAMQGRCTAMDGGALSYWVKRLGEEAGLPFPIGVRTFRYYCHDEAATSGASQRELELRFGRAPGSDELRRYIRFTPARAIEAMKRIRGITTTGHNRCHACRAALAPETQACMAHGCPAASPSGGPVSPAEQLGSLGLLLKGLDEVREEG